MHPGHCSMVHPVACVPGRRTEEPDLKCYSSAKRDTRRDVKCASFAFNPNASAFVPRSVQGQVVLRSAAHRGNGELAKVPHEILVQILRHIDSAKDLVRLASTCKHLRSVIPTAPVQVRLIRSLSIEQEHSSVTPGSHLRSSVHGSPDTVRQHLYHISASLSGITALDLAHTPCSDADVADTFAKLPQLESLRLDNCRKLSASICATIFSQSHSQLRTLCLQRCFQVTTGTLVDALVAAQQPGSTLSTLTLSHIHFLGPLPSPHKPRYSAATLRRTTSTSPPRCSGDESPDGDRIVHSDGSNDGSDSQPAPAAAAEDGKAGASPREVTTEQSRARSLSQSSTQNSPQGLQLMPAAPEAGAVQPRVNGSSLRVLALSCCDGLVLGHLALIASYTPLLQVLLLGGTMMAVPPPELSTAATSEGGVSAAAVEAVVQRVRAELVHEEVMAAAEGTQEASDAVTAAEEPDPASPAHDGSRRPQMALSLYAAAPALAGMLRDASAHAADDDGNGCNAGDAPLPGPYHSPRSPVAPAPAGARAVAHLKARRGGVRALGPYAIARAVAVVHAALLFPVLHVLEVSHLPPAITQLVRRTLECPDLAQLSPRNRSGAPAAEGGACDAETPKRGAAHGESVVVWNLCCLADAQRAEHAHDTQPDMAAAVRAAARSSGPARYTALHVAALEGERELALLLLRLGVAINARSKSGATALFAACEAGHASVARVLLLAGADMWIPTATHENCLYIAALKGNSEVVEELLRRCQQDGVVWVDKARYGDGWTPLMCCVVGDRVALAATLLRAAQPRALDLLLARNRHGQTALHLAAYRGAADMIKLLLQYQGRTAVRERDASGLTPAQVARKHLHKVAEALLSRRQYS